jgi:hypothetical protein
MTEDEIKEDRAAITHSIVAFATQYSDDPKILATMLSDATILVMGLADIELQPIFDRMTKTYPSAVRAGATLQGYSSTTQ